MINEEKAAPLFLFVGIVFILIVDKHLFFLKGNKMDKVYLLCLLLLSVFGIASIFQTNNVTKTLNGICIYLSAVVYYILFSTLIYCENNKECDVKNRKNKRKLSNFENTDLEKSIVKTLLYCSSTASLIFVVYQGVFLKLRIYGNLGYANSYALIILIMLILNELYISDKTYVVFQITYILAIIYTGSRNTLFYFGVFIIIKLIISIKNKTQKFYILLFDIGIAASIYFLLSLKYYIFLTLVPLIIYFIYELSSKLSNRIKKVASIFLVGISLLTIFYTSSNTIIRLKNVSLNTGVLQERFIYYEDAIKYILKNPFGSGINSFEYRQFYQQSAFYDVKYIHNSFLQVGYDLGIIGMVTFIVILVYGFIKIIKGKSKSKIWIATSFLIISMHSFLDFDFSYVSIFTIFILIFIIGTKDSYLLKHKQTEKKEKYLLKFGYVGLSLSLILSSYLIFVNLVYFMGDNFVIKGEYDKAIKLYDINKKITLRDPEIYVKQAEVYKRKGGSDEKNLNQCIDLLTIAEKINPYDPRITANKGFIYERLNKNDEADYCYSYVVSHEKFNQELYTIYVKFLRKQYDITKDEKYIVKIDKLKNVFYNNKKLLNPKYIYLKDQMTEFQ